MWDNSVHEKITRFVLAENEYIFSGDTSAKL